MITINEKINWLIGCITDAGYEVITDDSTPEQKLQFIADNFKKEAYYQNNIKSFGGNNQKIISDHLQGLPSYISIPFSNYDILELGRAWGYDLSTEGKEDGFIDRYWGGCCYDYFAGIQKIQN